MKQILARFILTILLMVIPSARLFASAASQPLPPGYNGSFLIYSNGLWLPGNNGAYITNILGGIGATATNVFLAPRADGSITVVTNGGLSNWNIGVNTTNSMIFADRLGNLWLQVGWTNQGSGNWILLMTNKINGAYKMWSTNSHLLGVDEWGTTNKSSTNGLYGMWQTNGNYTYWSNGSMYVSGGATASQFTGPLAGNATTATAATHATNFWGFLSPTNLPIATTLALGGVKPDGTTITVNGSGVIAAVAGTGGTGIATNGGTGIGNQFTNALTVGTTNIGAFKTGIGSFAMFVDNSGNASVYSLVSGVGDESYGQGPVIGILSGPSAQVTNSLMVGPVALKGTNIVQVDNPSRQRVLTLTTNGVFQVGTNNQLNLDTAGNINWGGVATGDVSGATNYQGRVPAATNLVGQIGATNVPPGLIDTNLIGNYDWLRIRESQFSSYNNVGRFVPSVNQKIRTRKQVKFEFDGTGLVCAPEYLFAQFYTNLFNAYPFAGWMTPSIPNASGQTLTTSASVNCYPFAGYDTNWYQWHYKMTNSSSTLTETASYQYDTILIGYIGMPTGGGTWKVQTNGVDVSGATFSSTASVWTGLVATVTLPAPINNAWKLVATGAGTNEFVQLGCWDSTVAGGVIVGTMSQPSSHPLNYLCLLSGNETNVMGPIYRGMGIDLLFWQSPESYTPEAATGNNVTNAINFFRTLTNTAVIYCGNYPLWNDAADPGNGVVTYDAYARTNCQKYVFGYFDAYNFFESYTNWMQRGFGTGDGIHGLGGAPAVGGYGTYCQALWDWVGLDHALLSGGTGSGVPGVYAGAGMTGVTNGDSTVTLTATGGTGINTNAGSGINNTLSNATATVSATSSTALTLTMLSSSTGPMLHGTGTNSQTVDVDAGGNAKFTSVQAVGNNAQGLAFVFSNQTALVFIYTNGSVTISNVATGSYIKCDTNQVILQHNAYGDNLLQPGSNTFSGITTNGGTFVASAGVYVSGQETNMDRQTNYVSVGAPDIYGTTFHGNATSASTTGQASWTNTFTKSTTNTISTGNGTATIDFSACDHAYLATNAAITLKITGLDPAHAQGYVLVLSNSAASGTIAITPTFICMTNGYPASAVLLTNLDAKHQVAIVSLYNYGPGLTNGVWANFFTP